MILVTIGSMFPFDRLIEAMDGIAASGLLNDQFFAQIGSGRYEPRHMSYERFVDKASFDQLVEQADAVISHAGVGTIASALSLGKPLLVLPRRGHLGEHVNDHQVGTARRYAELGHVLVAYTEADLPQMLSQLATFRPKPRTVNAKGIASRIDRFIREGR